ncbi:MAG TPA: glutamate-cysteine ligase family protein [Saprospiraceae bacterium]|nr:glutamate-cysteine ligase family protein [Saprospiraceae bacterium]
MGEQRVSLVSDKKQMQKFLKALLDDVKAMEYMLENGWFEENVSRIGAEQEMVLVDKNTFKPATNAMEALDLMKDKEWVETELAKFNLEINLTPRKFEGSCFSELEKETKEKLTSIQKVLDTLDTQLVLTGILPTIHRHHVEMENLTPKKRYFALMEAIRDQLLGPNFELNIVGIDELIMKHTSPLVEAVNTSFQVHLQVSPTDFVQKYNISQVLAAPIMAVAANSPIVFGKRLWHESRIAMFQQSIDTRSSHDHMRERSARVSFGKDWIHDSILDIYREDISRFRVLLSSDVEEDSLALLKKGQVPKLRALQVHNSTVYRWNRPCYGISDNGKPHLRIENRVLPSGPTVMDEIANAVFWLGAMEGLAMEVKDVRDRMSFEDAKDNFVKAAKFGIDSKFTWFDDEKISAVDLILEKLIPISRKGLLSKGINQKDIDRFLGIIKGRAESHMNGARWLLRSYTDLIKKTNKDAALTLLTSQIAKYQKSGIPVHEWETPSLSDLLQYNPDHLMVSEFMNTDLITVQKDDIVELVAELMDWQKIRYCPVEDNKGNLIGLVTSRHILRHLLKYKGSKKTFVVEDIMIEKLITVNEKTNIVEALNLMNDYKIGCLPVVSGDALIGIITESDFIAITSRLLDRLKTS